MENQTPENEDGIKVLAKIKDEDGFMDAVPELAAMFVPKVRFLFPLIEGAIKEYVRKNNAIIIIKEEKSGSISANIFDKSKMLVTFKEKPDGEKYKPSEAILYNDKGEPMVYNTEKLKKLLEGENFENMLKNFDFSKIFE